MNGYAALDTEPRMCNNADTGSAGNREYKKGVVTMDLKTVARWAKYYHFLRIRELKERQKQEGYAQSREIEILKSSEAFDELRVLIIKIEMGEIENTDIY